MQTKRWNVKSGFREDLGVSVRSGWEADVLRYLTYKKITWEYEPRKFAYPIKRGTISYTPDVWLPKQNIYLEIKGSISVKDKTKIKRFKKYYPEETLMGIPGSPNTEAARFFNEVGVEIYACFKELEKEYKLIVPNWGE